MSSTLGTDVAETAALRAMARINGRRLLARVHLWIALGLGLYIVVLSVSGSAVATGQYATQRGRRLCQ